MGVGSVRVAESPLPEWPGGFKSAGRPDTGMKHVRVTLTAGGREAEVHPMYDIVANAEFVERATAMQWNIADDELGILHYVEGDIEAFEAAVSDVDEVIDYTLEPAGDDAFYAYIWDAMTESLREFFGAIARGGVVVVPPIVYHEDGTVTLSAFGPSGALQKTLAADYSPVELTVEEIGGLSAIGAAAESRLSDRQREAVEAALDLGYYEVPREADHKAVADRLGCAPSTAAEHLRKAESKVLRTTFA